MRRCAVRVCEIKVCIGRDVCALRRYFLTEQAENRKLLRSLRKGSRCWVVVHGLIYPKGN